VIPIALCDGPPSGAGCGTWSFNNNGTYAPWQDNFIEAQVTLPPDAGTDLNWDVFVISDAWISGEAAANPSTGEFEEEAGPTLQLKLNGTPITGMPNVVVGQYVDLTAAIVNGTGQTISSYKWTVPSNTAMTWAPFGGTSSQGQPVPVPASASTSNEVDFAWTAQSPNIVSLSVMLSDRTPLSASAQFNITVPSITPSATVVGSVILPNQSSPTTFCPEQTILAMCLASPSGGPGISFFYTPLTVGDSYEWVQVVVNSPPNSPTTIDKTDTSGNVCEVSTQGLDAKDPNNAGPLPSPDGVNANDSPSVPLGSPYQKIVTTESFSTFLMYMPKNGMWVPLYRFDWTWSAEADLVGSNWSVKSSGSGGDIPKIQTSTYPQWTQIVDPNAACTPKQ